MVSPPSDASKAAALGIPPNRPGGTATPPDSQPDNSVAPARIALDRTDIRPLDLAGALQILIAEVRAELARLVLEATDISTSANAATPAVNADTVLPAARDILESVLNSLPQSSPELAVWSEALPAIDAAVALGLARAASIIETWRDVPGPVVASAQEVRALVSQALSDEPLNPIWLRPEGLNLAPQLTRLRRRRKLLQRRVTDPDYRPSIFDDPEPLT
jgi:hypothetical protein